MKGATILAKLQQLGIMPSFSRPSVSNDNPYSEAAFRTLKYTPAYPKQPFADIHGARQWVQYFVTWYNTEHRHIRRTDGWTSGQNRGSLTHGNDVTAKPCYRKAPTHDSPCR